MPSDISHPQCRGRVDLSGHMVRSHIPHIPSGHSKKKKPGFLYTPTSCFLEVGFRRPQFQCPQNLFACGQKFQTAQKIKIPTWVWTSPELQNLSSIFFVLMFLTLQDIIPLEFLNLKQTADNLLLTVLYGDISTVQSWFLEQQHWTTTQPILVHCSIDSQHVYTYTNISLVLRI